MAIKVLIADDEPFAREQLVQYVKSTPYLELTGTCSNGVETIRAVKEMNPDIVFLDIEMPGLNGLDASEIISENVKIVFTTAYEKYAIDGFKVGAVDYLLKPISYADFIRASERATGTIRNDKSQSQPTESTAARSLFIKSAYKTEQVNLDDIIYIEGMQNYVKIFKSDGECLTSHLSMKSIEEKLPSDAFIRVHRSYIVNIGKVKTIERSRIIFGKIRIPISESYRNSFYDGLSKRSIIVT